MGQFVKPILSMTPPDITGANPVDWMGLLQFGKRFRDLGDRRARLVKLMTMSAADLLDEWFESDHLKAPMAVSGIIGTCLGVRSPGTAYVLLHHYMGEIDGAYRSWGFSKGGTGGVSMALARAAEAFGAEILTEAPVHKVLLGAGGEATGVVLDNGDEYQARQVISGLDPNLTFKHLVGEENLEPEFAKSLSHFKYRGSSGKVNLALDRAPSFSARPGVGPHLFGDIAIAPSVEYLSRAYDEAKYGQYSSKPYLNIVVPSMVDPTVAPPGKHIMSIFVQYAPYHLEGGPHTWPDHRDAFGETVIDTVAQYVPGLRESIIFKQVLTPWDMEKEFGLTEGNIFHGELNLEQLFFLRPTAKFARYRTPIPKLWMCSSGTHPGGGIMGAPGANAARDILKSGEI
jgi:phytoene dehydrogenase-like protein